MYGFEYLINFPLLVISKLLFVIYLPLHSYSAEQSDVDD